MRKGFLKYGEKRKYLVIYGEAVSHIWLCTRSLLNFLIHKENLFTFLSVYYVHWCIYEIINTVENLAAINNHKQQVTWLFFQFFPSISGVRTREGWPLLTAETKVNGDSNSERGPSLVGLLGSSCWLQETFIIPWLLWMLTIVESSTLSTSDYYLRCTYSIATTLEARVGTYYMLSRQMSPCDRVSGG